MLWNPQEEKTKKERRDTFAPLTQLPEGADPDDYIGRRFSERRMHRKTLTAFCRENSFIYRRNYIYREILIQEED